MINYLFSIGEPIIGILALVTVFIAIYFDDNLKQFNKINEKHIKNEDKKILINHIYTKLNKKIRFLIFGTNTINICFTIILATIICIQKDNFSPNIFIVTIEYLIMMLFMYSLVWIIYNNNTIKNTNKWLTKKINEELSF